VIYQAATRRAILSWYIQQKGKMEVESILLYKILVSLYLVITWTSTWMISLLKLNEVLKWEYAW